MEYEAKRRQSEAPVASAPKPNPQFSAASNNPPVPGSERRVVKLTQQQVDFADAMGVDRKEYARQLYGVNNG